MGLLTSLPVTAQASASGPLPMLGDGQDMSLGAERRLGDRIARELYRDPDFLDDPVLGDYVQGVWQPLLAAARVRGDLSPELDERFAWRVMLGRDRTVNAFALPGGYLGVHLGLLAVVSSRDELASVLGHELSHVTQRHIARLMGKSSQQTPWVIGAMILGALAASKNADTGNAVILGGQALAAQSQLNFSRDMEREADRVGFGVMTQAGFESQGFVTMFDKLQQAARLNDTGAYPYLRSHPLTTERIADMQSRLPLGAPHAVAVQPSLVHAMLSARARALSDTGVDAQHGWQAQAAPAALVGQPPAQQAGVLYGAAVAALQLREVAQARSLLARLQKLVVGDAEASTQARWLGVSIELADVAHTSAQWLALGEQVGLGQSSTVMPRRPELVLQATVAVRSGQPAALAEVAQRLQTWVAAQPHDALAWQTLAAVYMAQQQVLRALRAEAESRVAQMNPVGALDTLKAAQDRLSAMGEKTSADHIDASIIDTRRRQMEALIKAQALEK